MDSLQTVKQEMGASGDDYDYHKDVKVDELPVQLETKNKVNLRKTMYSQMDSHQKVKSEIGALGDDYDYDIDVKVEEHPIKVELNMEADPCSNLTWPDNSYLQVLINEKTYRYRHYNKYFAQKCYLEPSMRTHTGEKPYHGSQDLFQFINQFVVTDPDTVIAPTKQDMIIAPIVSHKPRRARRRRDDVSMVVNGSKIRYSCSRCSQTFRTEPGLKIHQHSHKKHLNNYKNNNIVKPPMVFRSLEEPQGEPSTHLHSHNIPKQSHHNHLGDKPFSCPLCNRGFSLKHDCLLHLVTQVCTRADRYLTTITGCWECNTCKQVFSVRTQAERHIRMHDTGRGMLCPVCSEDFTGAKPHVLVKHVKDRHPEYPEDLGLNGSHDLGNKLITCPLCNRGFKGKHDRLVHLVNEVCTRADKYLATIMGCWECNTCKKVFSARDQAEHHIRKHESGRGTQCPVCSEDFTGNKHAHALLRHVKDRHPEYLDDLGC